ncbi:hypothetical protein ABB37_06456 [Leptomonas pyrrhocoris]|uniref:PB1 domain-containing protein n=1 Tax=Leptomonas pyrrhocoris TaxID=157538 RepID=A0A0N0DU41_LEPPY|nr:hypothetical protein ABB37_06456 [Leptomonas pyrrhocoris]KPA78322.1 hypothetical protein ABB37_06456 [Leptomonas pyrrhocoris]|eukprot:XP_015656761.1 hypothetical protein ABB37_06456 [Leptomonas pyrrhocoris]
MSRPAETVNGTRRVVSPPPSLAANGARHRSNGNYVKSFGRNSFELQQQQLKSKQPLQPALQETAKRVNSKPTVCGNGCGGGALRQVRSPVVAMAPSHITVSANSSDTNAEGEDVDLSPFTTPAQSYVPEHRRRGGHVDAAAPRVAATGKQTEKSADKENTHVTAAATAAAAVAPGGAAPKSSSSSAGTPTALLRSGPSSARGGAAGGGGPCAATSTSPSAARVSASSQRGPAPKRTVNVKDSRTPATAAGQRKVASSASATAGSSTTTAPSTDAKKERVAVAATRQRTPSPELDGALRMQLDQADSVLTYVVSIARALGERRRCGPPPDSTDDFRASMVPRRRSTGYHVHHSRVDEGIDDAEEEEGAPDGVGGEGAAHHNPSSFGSVALLPDLHRAASGLLSAFTKLEYAHLGEDVDLPLLEKTALERGSQLLRVVDGVARQLSLHEAPEVRRLFADHRSVFAEMHQLVDFVARMAQQVVLLRDIAAHHDLGEAREVWDSFRKSVEVEEERQHQHYGGSGGGGVTDNDKTGRCACRSSSPRRLFFPLSMLKASPFFQWLESRWFPAMRAWRQLVLDARQLASTGRTDAAIRRSRMDALQIAGLQEILRPGETVSDLHHAQIVVPVTELGHTFARKQAVMDQLRSLMAEPDSVIGAVLAPALKAAQAYTQVRSGCPSGGGNRDDAQRDDAALVKQAEDLLHRIQEAERLRSAVDALLQTPSPTLETLLDHITRVNELLLRWRLPYDAASARVAVAVGRGALAHGTAAHLSPPSPLHHGQASDATTLFSPPRAADVDGNVAAGADLAGSPLPPQVPLLNFNALKTNGTAIPAQLSRHSATATWIGEGFPADFPVSALYIPHTTTAAWPADFDVLYRELCDVFAMLFSQGQAQRQLEQALGHTPDDRAGTRQSKTSYPNDAGLRTPSAQVTPRRPTHDVGSPAGTQRSSEDSARMVTTARSSNSAESSSLHNCHRWPSVAAAAGDLRQRIQQAEAAGISGALIDAARARLRRLLTARLKIHFDAQTRVMPVADAAQAKFTDVYDQLHAHCQAQLAQSSCSGAAVAVGTSSSPEERRLRIRYEDVDGDFISLLNQQDWDVMLSELLSQEENGSGSSSGGGKIELFCDYPITPSLAPPPQQQQRQQRPSYGNERQESVGWTDFQTIDDDFADASAAAAAAPAATTPEKQPNVFERLATTKDATPNASGGRGAGANAHRPVRGRPRLGGPSAASATQNTLIPRSRNPAGANGSRPAASPGKGSPGGADVAKYSSPAPAKGAAQRGGGSESSPGKKTGTDATGSPTAAASTVQSMELTADNLRRNLFLSSPSPPSAQGRDSGKDACRRSGEAASAKKAAELQDEEDPAAVTTAAATADGHNVSGGNSGTRLVAKENPFESALPSSAVHVNIDAARRWTAAGEDDDFQLLEIQTRASASTTRMDPCLSSCSVETALPPPSSCVATAASSTTLSPSGGRNTFTTTHCSGKVADNHNAVPAPTVMESNAHDSQATASANAATNVSSTNAPEEKEGAQHQEEMREERRKKERLPQSPPRHAPRRWTSDDFTLDEVKTVCSERSRMAMMPVVPRGPTSLPPRPQTPSREAAANRTPQRQRRGARGTPTRGRPDGADIDEGEAAQPAEDVFAEMQRMRDENTRAMAQPRKAAWH